jgi:phenylacetate-CoA ligase
MPVLTKNLIRSEEENLLSERPGKEVRWNTSGGSTGEPIRLRQDRDMAWAHRSNELMYLGWAGHQLGEPHVLIWGVPQETMGGKPSFHEKVFRFACNQTYLNCYETTDEILEGWIEVINRVRPSVIEAYVDAIFELSKYVLANNRAIFRPKGIITSAGVLTEARRIAIESAFCARVYNRYGSREVANVACSCFKNNELHVNEAWCHLEIVDDDGQPCATGEEGDILVTLFHNRTMPLIRYRIEDRGVWADGFVCACGRKTRRLATVVGRRNDFLIALGDKKINGTALTTLLYGVPGIRRYQYHQDANGTVTLLVELFPDAQATKTRKALDPLIAQLRRLLGGRQVELKITETVLPSKSGKYRYVVNDMVNSASATTTLLLSPFINLIPAL